MAKVVRIKAKVAKPTPEKVEFRKFRDGRTPVRMEFMPGYGENLTGEQAVYFFKFFNEETLEFNKIGTSATDVIKRLRREISDYSKDFAITRVEIHRIRPCFQFPAEGAESALRAAFIRRYPEAFHKNDRFFGVNITTADFDKIVDDFFL